MIKRPAKWDTRSAVSKWAHVMERVGLALAGGACGLFVAAHMMSANIDLGSAIMVLAMMLYGALGFYLGIDLPPPVRSPQQSLLDGHNAKTDAVELLSAAGTFLNPLTAGVSVYAIVADEHLRASTVLLIGLGWSLGATMQIAAGIVARLRYAHSLS
jgi:hypothetical protein